MLYKDPVVNLSKVTYERGLAVLRGIHSFEATLGNLQRPDFRLQSGSRDTELGSRTGGSIHPPSAIAQGSLNDLSLSLAAGFRASSSWVFGLLARGCRENQLSSTEKFSVSHTITDRSMTFCNSRMFPGQGYDPSNWRVFLSTLVMFLPAVRA